MRTIVAAFVVAAVAGTVALAQVPVVVTWCEGFDCNGKCHEEKLLTKTCYQDPTTGSAVSFMCLRNTTWDCFEGSTYNSSGCRAGAEVSRNSLA